MISTSRAEYVEILEHVGPIYISLDALSKLNRVSLEWRLSSSSYQEHNVHGWAEASPADLQLSPFEAVCIYRELMTHTKTHTHTHYLSIFCCISFG